MKKQVKLDGQLWGVPALVIIYVYLHIEISPDELQLDYSPKGLGERLGLGCLCE